MGYALVGSLGSIASALSGTLTPSWGTGESRTANNLLLCWLWINNSTGSIAVPSGWTRAVELDDSTSTQQQGAVFYRIATGSDAAPGVTTNGPTLAMLGEFSGNATSSPVDQTGNNNNSFSASLAVTNAAADAAAGELVAVAFWAAGSFTNITSISHSFNNGGGSGTTSLSGGGTANAASFGFAITTGHASADSDTATCNATPDNGIGGVMASFKLGSGAVAAFPPKPIVISQAVRRAKFF